VTVLVVVLVVQGCGEEARHDAVDTSDT